MRNSIGARSVTPHLEATAPPLLTVHAAMRQSPVPSESDNMPQGGSGNSRSREGRPSSLRRFLTFLRPYFGLLALASLGGMVKFGVPLLVPMATRFLLDDVFLDQSMSFDQKMNQLRSEEHTSELQSR